jgi:signal transduction histidine kinase
MKFSTFRENLKQPGSNILTENESSDSAKNLKGILDIVKSINKSLILENVLELVLKYAIDISFAERGFIVLKDSKGKLEFKLGIDSNNNKLPESSFNISTTVVEDVFFNGKSKFIEGALSDTDHDPSKSIFKLELQTILCSPLVTAQKKIGVIYVDSKRIQKVKVNDITDTFEILAGQAAIAIRNAQLYKGQIKAYESLQNANQKLREAKDEAERLSKLKTEFLAQMSHEIRTPINTIFGFTSILKDTMNTKLPAEQGETFQIINAAGQRIIRTIDLILEMSQIHTGNYEYNPVILDLGYEVLENQTSKYRRYALRKNLKFEFLNEAVNKKILADKHMIDQVFSNLIENAIKFTNEGEIIVRLYSNGDNKINVDVSDTGIGMSEEYQENMYKAFSQEDRGYTRKFDGNGLGLAIVKSYVDINKATLKLTSQKGKGALFTIAFSEYLPKK